MLKLAGGHVVYRNYMPLLVNSPRIGKISDKTAIHDIPALVVAIVGNFFVDNFEDADLRRRHDVASPLTNNIGLAHTQARAFCLEGFYDTIGGAFGIVEALFLVIGYRTATTDVNRIELGVLFAHDGIELYRTTDGLNNVVQMLHLT